MFLKKKTHTSRSFDLFNNELSTTPACLRHTETSLVRVVKLDESVVGMQSRLEATLKYWKNKYAVFPRHLRGMVMK